MLLSRFFLLGCGQSKKEIEEYQKKAFYEGFILLSGQKAMYAELFSEKNKCFNTEESSWLKKSQAEIIKTANYVKILNHKNDCTINITFKDSDFAPI